MLIVTRKIHEYLNKKGINRHKLSLLIDYKPGSLYKMIKGEDKFPDQVVEKIASVFEIPVEKFESWILADKYSKEVLELALQVKRESINNDKLILTTKIDEILQSKNMSRTQLSKLAKYDQSSINKMLTGKESFSKTVLTKISNTLEIPETNIQSWLIADKYSLQALESVLKIS